MQPIRSDPVQRRVIEDNDTVGIQCQTFQSQQRVVRLNDNITDKRGNNQSMGLASFGQHSNYLVSARLGKTLYVWMSFLGKRSEILSSMYEPKPEPVPPAIEWQTVKAWVETFEYDSYEKSNRVMKVTSRFSLPSASLSMISNISSNSLSPWA